MATKPDGYSLKVRMIRHGIRQTDLAEKLGRTQSTVSANLSKAIMKPVMYRAYTLAIDELIEAQEEEKER